MLFVMPWLSNSFANECSEVAILIDVTQKVPVCFSVKSLGSCAICLRLNTTFIESFYLILSVRVLGVGVVEGCTLCGNFVCRNHPWDPKQ